jgi:hypothetical protein
MDKSFMDAKSLIFFAKHLVVENEKKQKKASIVDVIVRKSEGMNERMNEQTNE